MDHSNYSVTEEEIICSSVQRILGVFRIANYFPERVGVEISLQNGKIHGSNLNFYKTHPSAVGNINCLTPLSDSDKEEVKQYTYSILKTLHIAIPTDLFGTIEVIAEFDVNRKMRIYNVVVNFKSFFKLETARR
jgi:hypothetical protein